jgi:uncharacterized protein (TIGR02302 family)
MAAAAAPTRIDAWIDPPAYTGKPPIVLPLREASDKTGAVSAPVSSTVVVRAANADIRVATQGGIVAEAVQDAKNGAAKEQHYVLRGNGRLTLSGDSGEIASFELRAIPDLPPKITPLGPPQINLRGTFALTYRIEDDYGAKNAQVTAKLAENPEARPLVQPPAGSLDLPPGPGGLGEGKTPDPRIYLGLRFVHDSLRHARNDAELLAVADLLWEMALRIEEGDVSQAERDLRAAEQALRDALKRGASPEEIAKLTEQLQKALDQYLSALQQNAAKNQQSADGETGENQSVSPQDLKAMLDQLADAAKNGDKEAAMDMLDRMRDMLENLKTAEQSQRSKQASQARKMMRDIDNLMREQQKLRDDTYSRERGDPKGFDDEANEDDAQAKQQGESQQGQKDSSTPSPGARKGKSQGQQGGGDEQQSDQAAQEALGQRQGALEERLNSLRRRAEQQGGEKSEGLSDAAEAMKQAEQALKQGDNESALGAQGRALDGLRKGAAEMAQKGGDNGPSDDQDQAGEKEGQGLKGQNGEGRFGRANKQNNIDATAAQKARKVLEELRRRLSDPSRAREELDYLERLIKPD